jgi:diguanylate cyclase (GGDEF)-like protein
MKILLVEDSAIDRRKVATCLKDWGLDYVVVESGLEAAKILEQPDPPSMALLDWVLPGVDGIELCRKIRKIGTQGAYIYTVMLTSKNRRQDLLTAIEAGADDYLAKPVNASELRARILVGKRILDLQQSLKFAATHDVLTDVINRSEILAALEREFSRSGREGRPAVIILADIDHFKQTNDSMGHAAGDAVLKEVARRLKMDLRPYDVVGRYGGEEFLIILPGCELPVGVRRANEIRTLVAKSPIAMAFGTTSATVSMGVTVSCGNTDHTVADVLHQADMALYSAKKNGRNRVEAFAPAAHRAKV